MKRRHVIACAVLCALLAVGSVWLGCALPGKWAIAVFAQFMAFCIAAVVCAFVASETES